jgi:hypothetical protein
MAMIIALAPSTVLIMAARNISTSPDCPCIVSNPSTPDVVTIEAHKPPHHIQDYNIHREGTTAKKSLREMRYRPKQLKSKPNFYRMYILFAEDILPVIPCSFNPLAALS